MVLVYLQLRPQTPTRALPMDPAGGLLSPVPRFCPPPEQISGYAPVVCILCVCVLVDSK